MSDPICNVCGEPRSVHVATDAGPLTHPKEARGEGTYVLVKDGHIEGSYWPGEDEHQVAPVYRFVPKKQANAT